MNTKALSPLAATLLAVAVAQPTQAQTQLWRQTQDRATIVSDLTEACIFPPAGAPAETSGGDCLFNGSNSTFSSSYFRLFDRTVPDFYGAGAPVVGAFEVIQVNVGVECLDSDVGFIELDIGFFDAPTGTYAPLNILDTRTVTIPLQGSGVLAVPICPPIFVPADVDFVVLGVAATSPVNQRFFIGANTGPQSAPGAARHPTCVPPGINPTPGSTILEFVSNQPVGEIDWTQSEDSTAVQPSPIACTIPMTGEIAETSYWRLYDHFDPITPDTDCSPLPASGCPLPRGPDCLPGGIEVQSVTVGIGGSANSGSRQVTINIYEDLDGGALGPLSSLDLLRGETFTLPDVFTPTVMTFSFDKSIFVPEEARWIAVEFKVEQGGTFSIGTNGLGEVPVDSSYISAPVCGLTDPVTFASIGFPNQHMILGFNTRPMSIGGQCIVQITDFKYPFETCGYRLPDPLVVELFMPPSGTVSYSPPRFLVIDVLIRGFDNIVETDLGGGVFESTFDCLVDLHVTGQPGTPLEGVIDRRLTLRPRIPSGPIPPCTGVPVQGVARSVRGTPVGPGTFDTEIVDLSVSIEPCDADPDFANLTLTLGTTYMDPGMPGMNLTSSGEALVIVPPCAGTFIMGEFGTSGMINEGEGMGHSPLQSGQWPAAVEDVEVQIDPPIEDPTALEMCIVAQVPNSTDQVGRIRAEGSGSTTNQQLLIVAEDLPPGQTAFFLVSENLGFIAQPGASVGNICLAGPIGRYACTAGTPQASGGPCVPGQVGSGPTVSIDIWNDEGVPGPMSPGNLAPFPVAGQTFYWQCWHRDPPPSSVSNFTNVVGVTFY